MKKMCIAGSIVLFAARVALAGQPVDRPNVVLLIGDDISPDFSCYGGDARTPNIDRLASRGVRFQNAYVTASSCSPSRSSMITGRYPHNTGAPELHMGLPEGQFMFPQALKDAGYYCAQAGKWHLGEAAFQAFDHVYEFEDADDPGHSDRFVPCLQGRPKDRPFFMWFASIDAHRPWQPDPDGVPVIDASEVKLPAGVPDTPKARDDLAAYLVEVQRFDRYVGGVVDELKRQGVLDNTLIILLGDNGRPFPRNKTTVYDNGVKTPLIVHWPNGGLKAGAVSRSLISAIDIAPAILTAAGLPVPPQVQGEDLMPVCRNPELEIHDRIFAERNWHVQRACQRMVREGPYVYIHNFAPSCYSFQMVDHATGSYAELLRLKAEGKLTPEQAEEFSTDMPVEMLFNVDEDPQQLNNLAENPERRQIVERLRGRLDDWQQRTGDSIPDLEKMTPDRCDRVTFERLSSEAHPSGGIVPGQTAGAESILAR
jgi:arylsulfatase